MAIPSPSKPFRFFPFLWALLGLTAAAAERPNIVWIVSEDNGAAHLRLYDPRGAPTPHLESLAQRGIVFDHAFANAPVCSVARSTLITSGYAPRLGLQYHRRSALVPMPAGHRMFPAYLRDAGYYTSNNSKEDYNAIKAPDVWDDSSKRASYRNRTPDQPFFHVQNFGATHEGQLFFTAEDRAIEPTQTQLTEVRVPPYLPDTPLFRYTVARYLDLHLKLDRQIGEFLAQLEADGVLDDTIVFYYGDHGGVLPRSKGYAYESGLHVPLIVAAPPRWQHLVPGEPGSRESGFVSFVDFGATVLNLAGVAMPDAFDGRPFLGADITAENLAARDTVFGHADRFDEKSDFVRTVRRGNFKYLRHYTPFTVDMLYNEYRYHQLAYQEWRRLYRAGELTPAQAQFFEPRRPEALYDLSVDPDEMNNLAADPAHAAVADALRTTLKEHLIATADLSFYPESVLVSQAIDSPTLFGAARREEIKRLIGIADLALLPFAEAEAPLRVALASAHPWERYWGVMASSAFAADAVALAPVIRALASEDPEQSVRIRAAEFLGITHTADPIPLLTQELGETVDAVQALTILNTITLLRDHYGHGFELNPQSLARPFQEVAKRINYLEP